MRYTSLLLTASLLLVVGCQPRADLTQPEPSPTDETTDAALSPLTITLEKNVTEDAQATPHTKAVLYFTGAADRTVDLPEILGELMYVDSAAYEPYGDDVVAVFTSWWAGQGDEFVLRKTLDPATLTIEHRTGDEEGSCTPPAIVGTYEMPGDITVTIEGVDASVAQSSILFCHES